MNRKYEAIMGAPRPVCADRPRMPLQQRAAQFAPFAALTGYDEVLAETARQTEAEIYLDEGEIMEINRRLRQIRQNLAASPPVEVKVFFPDDRKSGGSYRTIQSRVLKIDEYRQKMMLENGEVVLFANIVSLLLL